MFNPGPSWITFRDHKRSDSTAVDKALERSPAGWANGVGAVQVMGWPFPYSPMLFRVAAAEVRPFTICTPQRVRKKD